MMAAAAPSAKSVLATTWSMRALTWKCTEQTSAHASSTHASGSDVAYAEATASALTAAWHPMKPMWVRRT